MTNEEIRRELFLKADEKYKKFSSSLIPNVPKEKFIGVRIPLLRKLAKEISKGDAGLFIKTGEEAYFEDVMLKGFCISCGNFSFSERLSLIKEHIDKIDNWSLCDSFVSSLKFTEGEKDRFYEFLLPLLCSKKEYEERFAIVVLLSYYNTIDRAIKNLELIAGCQEGMFYADMARAWAVAEIFALAPDTVLSFLKNDRMNDFTHNKACDKIRESLKTSPEDKNKVLKLKR